MTMAGRGLGLGFGGDGGIPMTIAGGGLGLGFGRNSPRRQPPAAAATKRQRRVRWEREGGQRRQPMNGGAQRCHATTSKRRVQREAEVLAERRRQANGQHDNQRSSWGQWCDCNKAQSRQLRCGGSQMGNQPIERGGG